MARINIEDSLYKDHRFVQLVIRFQDLDKAVGAMVRAWSVAQKWYLSESQTIPADEWLKQNLKNEIIEVGLAERMADESVRICGADEQFNWLTQRVEAGRRGGLTKKSNALAVAKRSLAVAKQTLANASKPKQTLPSYSSSFSSSLEPFNKPTEASHSDLLREAEELPPPFLEECVFGDSWLREKLKDIPNSTLFTWIRNLGFEDKAYTENELKLAFTWLDDNPGKSKRPLVSFLNNWLNKSKKDRERYSQTAEVDAYEKDFPQSGLYVPSAEETRRNREATFEEPAATPQTLSANAVDGIKKMKERLGV